MESSHARFSISEKKNKKGRLNMGEDRGAGPGFKRKRRGSGGVRDTVEKG